MSCSPLGAWEALHSGERLPLLKLCADLTRSNRPGKDQVMELVAMTIDLERKQRRMQADIAELNYSVKRLVEENAFLNRVISEEVNDD